MIKQPLHENWTVRATGDLSEVPQPLRGLVLPAQVPGCVTTDLLRAGKIADPYLDENEFQTRWIGHTDWQYTLVFDADPKLFDHERIDLVADGLDTVATIRLNGAEIARTENMHRGYRFALVREGEAPAEPGVASDPRLGRSLALPTRSVLRQGKNELTITFASPVKYANTMWDKLGGRPYCNGAGGRFNFIRKMACNFGWDWGPALPTSGIWRGIRLEGWNKIRIASIRPEISVPTSDGRITLSVHFDVEASGNTDAQFEISLSLGLPEKGGGFSFKKIGATYLERPSGKLSAVVQTESRDMALWWPRGHGAQTMHPLSVQVDEVSAGRIYHHHLYQHVGLRTVELDTSPDDIGRKFVIKVNGKPIFCKGFNWIPDDCFLDRACDPTRVRQRIQQAVDAGGNMLRVWGGGIYETDDFYSICDEMGVLVWQDFLFACAMYPEEEPFRSEVEAEARYNVARLAHHPSLAIWNGCNENIWAYRNWGWQDAVKDKTWAKGFYFDLLPKVCRELTPTIPYWAGSPWSGDYDVDNGVLPNADTHGNKHVWDADAVADYRNYRNYSPRFASEFGVQGPSNYSTIAKVVPPESRDFGSPQMRHRQKSGDQVRDDADRKNLRQIVRDFNLPGAAELLAALDSPDLKAKVPECGCGPLHPAKALPSKVNFDDLHYLLSVQQCRALTTAVEFWRSRQPACWGTLYWQLNDCWPGGPTWSCIDGDGKEKPLWHATRRFYADVLGTFQPEPDGSLSFYVVNDTDEPFDDQIDFHRGDFNGNRIAWTTARVQVPSRSVTKIPLDPHLATPGDATSEMIWSGLGIDTWFFAADKELRYPYPEFDAQWDGRRLTVSSKTLLRDTCIFADRLDPEARVSQQMITLLGGNDMTVFEIDSKIPLTLEQLTAPPVFRCVNGFGKM